MSRHVEDGECMVSELHHIPLVEVSLQRDGRFALHDAERADAVRQLVQPGLVCPVRLGADAVGFPDKAVPEHMVEVQVRVNQSHDAQPVRLDEALELLLLRVVITAAIDDDGFLRFVPHHIRVLREHIEFKSLDV